MLEGPVIERVGRLGNDGSTDVKDIMSQLIKLTSKS
jgi:hypothetical protein